MENHCKFFYRKKIQNVKRNPETKSKAKGIKSHKFQVVIQNNCDKNIMIGGQKQQNGC